MKIICQLLTLCWILLIADVTLSCHFSIVRKRRSVVGEGVLRSYFGRCMKALARTSEQDWDTNVDYTVLDSKWYENTKYTLCRYASNQTVCWKNRLRTFGGGSRYLTSAQECIDHFNHDYSYGNRDRYLGRKKRSARVIPRGLSFYSYTACLSRDVRFQIPRKKPNYIKLVNFIERELRPPVSNNVYARAYVPWQVKFVELTRSTSPLQFFAGKCGRTHFPEIFGVQTCSKLVSLKGTASVRCFYQKRPLVNVNQNFYIGTSCFINCLPGYELSGFYRAVCGSNGHWTPNIQETRCVLKIKAHNCSPPVNPTVHVNFLYSCTSQQYTVGTTCTASCPVHGQQILGAFNINCGFDRQWNPSDFTNTQCIDVPVCPPTHFQAPCKRPICRVVSCPAYPHAVCRPSPCGGCNFDFYQNGQKLLRQQCIPQGQCVLTPRCQQQCYFATCPGQTHAICHVNCQCIPRFYHPFTLTRLHCLLPINPVPFASDTRRFTSRNGTIYLANHSVEENNDDENNNDEENHDDREEK